MLDKLPAEIIAIIYDIHMNMNPGVCTYVYDSVGRSRYANFGRRINMMKSVSNEIKKIKYELSSVITNTCVTVNYEFTGNCTCYFATSSRKYNEVITYYMHRKQIGNTYVSGIRTVRGIFINEELRVWFGDNLRKYKHLEPRKKLASMFRNVLKGDDIKAIDRTAITEARLYTDINGYALEIIIGDDYIFPEPQQ